MLNLIFKNINIVVLTTNFITILLFLKTTILLLTFCLMISKKISYD